jgi:hypothetical protein
MANLPETPVWRDGVTQLELNTLVEGGPGGPMNQPANDLADRTAYLRSISEPASAIANIVALTTLL